MKILNPYNQELIEELSEDNAQSVADKFQKASAAQSSWYKLGLEERLKVIDRFNTLLQEEKEQCAQSQSLETGKPISQARGEISACQSRIQFFIDRTEQVLKEGRLQRL